MRGLRDTQARLGGKVKYLGVEGGGFTSGYHRGGVGDSDYDSVAIWINP